MALATPIQRTGLVQSVQAGPNGTVVVTLAVQPTTSTQAGQTQVQLSAAEWNEIVAEQSAGGTSGIGVSLSVTLQ